MDIDAICNIILTLKSLTDETVQLRPAFKFKTKHQRYSPTTLDYREGIS
uniref:Uncharacterized protein n=1 Tax=Anguilla anguilla TaxID=7936 RepID=A0A0E9UBJ1_ANGAN